MLSIIKKFILGRKYDAAVDATTTSYMGHIHAVGEILKSDDVKKPLVEFCVENEELANKAVALFQELMPVVEQVIAQAAPMIEEIKNVDTAPLKAASGALMGKSEEYAQKAQEELAFSYQAIFEAEEEESLTPDHEEVTA